MASLRGVAHGYGNPGLFSGIMYPGSPEYSGIFLSRNEPQPKTDYRIRPTGPIGSGPYFHAIKSGINGITGACSINGKKFVTHCDYSGDVTAKTSDGYDSRQAWHWIANGDYAMWYYVYNSTRPSGTRPYTNGLASITLVALWPTSIGYRTEERVVHWSQSIPSGSLATFDFFLNKVRYLGWSALSSWKGHDKFYDPELSVTTNVVYTSAGDRIDVHDGVLHYPHGELDAFEWWRLTGVMPGKYRSLGSEAYYNAATNLPQGAMNSIANVLEVASTVADLLKGDWGSLFPSSGKDAWLFYRYQYSTTKLDIEEYKELTRRLAALAATPIITSNGSVSSGGITARCRIDVDPSIVIPSSTREWLSKYGLRLSALNVWDMIPYSFVADWFLHVGSFLEVMENAQWAYSLPVANVWTSFETHDSYQSTYLRVPGYFRAKCPYLDYTKNGTSGKTIVKRVLDSIALFL